jgi:hypothetical protein
MSESQQSLYTELVAGLVPADLAEWMHHGQG